MVSTQPQDQSVSAPVALKTLQGTVTEDEREGAADSLPVEIVTLLRAIDDRTEHGTGEGEDLDDDTAAAVFALCGKLVEYAERYERNAIRQLNKHQGYKWQEVADLHPRLDGRASAQKRWVRLCDDERRVSSGDFKRGAAVPRPKAPVVDTMTPEHSRMIVCGVQWGCCPEHGNTLRSSGGATWCKTTGCGRTWDYDRVQRNCEEPATFDVRDPEGGTGLMCDGHALDARVRLTGATMTAL